MTDDVLEWSARIDQAIEEYPEVQEYLDAIRGNIEALTARLNAVRELHREHDCTRGEGRCFVIVTGACAQEGNCGECLTPLPCPTITAVDGD